MPEAGPYPTGETVTRVVELRDGQSFAIAGLLDGLDNVEKLAKRPLSFEPGTKWQYSPALTVCGGIVEVVSGQPFDEFLRKRIFEPLKMADTSFHPTPEQQKRIVKLYQQGKDKKSLSATRHWINDLSEGMAGCAMVVHECSSVCRGPSPRGSLRPQSCSCAIAAIAGRMFPQTVPCWP